MSSQKESPTEAFIREVNTYKFIGVVVWHAAWFFAATAVWTTSVKVLAVPSTPGGPLLFYLLLTYGSMLGVLYTQRRVLTTIDVPPLYVAQLGWSSKTWPSLLLSRFVGGACRRPGGGGGGG